jgi:hypothetical protein
MREMIERTARRGSRRGLDVAIGLGVATGMRTFLGAAVLATELHEAGGRAAALLRRLPFRSGPGPLESALRRDHVRHGLQALAASELVADKLPGIPDRTGVGPLAARALVGAALGWAVARSDVRPVAALAAGCGAIVGAFAGNRARRLLTARVGLPDFAVAVVEDAAAIALASAAVRRRR